MAVICNKNKKENKKERQVSAHAQVMNSVKVRLTVAPWSADESSGTVAWEHMRL